VCLGKGALSRSRNGEISTTRERYSLLRVSISILSPISMKAGTGSSKPVAMRAGFITLPEVSPLTAGSVYTTSRTTLVGNSIEIALPL
jgi:hypothetical protein